MIKISQDGKLFFDSVSFIPYHNIESRTYEMINRLFIEDKELFEKPPIVNYAVIHKNDFANRGRIGRIHMMSAVEPDDKFMGVSIVITTNDTISSDEISRIKKAIRREWAHACVKHKFSLYESLNSMTSLGMTLPEAEKLLFEICDIYGGEMKNEQ